MLRKKLLNEKAEATNRGEAIVAAAQAEDRELTAEEMAEMATLKSRRAAIDAQLSVIEDQREAERTMAGAGTQGGAGAAPPIIRIHDLAEDKPWATRPGTSGLGEMLQAVARAELGGERDPRLIRAAATGANLGVPSEGGFLVGTAQSDALLGRAREESPILAMCREIPIGEGMDSLELPVIDETSRATGSRWGGVQVYRKAEAATVTATKPAFGKLRISSSEIMGLAYATDRLLSNAAAMERVFGDAFASEFAFKLTDEIIRGGGGDECLGILGNAPTIDQAKETGQAAATIVSANISKMWMHVAARSKARGVWLHNAECGPQLDELSIPAGTAALEPRFVSYDTNGALRIKGRPVLELEQCAALGTTGDFIFADFNEYIVSPKGAIDAQQSMHVRFIYGEMAFRWTYYINGRPAWLSSISAYKGNASQSPFVTLATRA